MKLEEQVCSLELAKKLKELGFKQESYFKWEISFGRPNLVPSVCEYNKFSTQDVKEEFSAFTVAELGELIDDASKQDFPGERKWTCGYPYTYKRTDGKWWCIVRPYPKGFVGHLDIEKHTESETEADARAKMLIYLLENNLVNSTNLNK